MSSGKAKIGTNVSSSILFARSDDGVAAQHSTAPDFFVDLGLDQIVMTVTAGKEEYGLRSFFFAPLHDPDAIRYRHEVMRDLEDPRLLDDIRAFAASMHAVREHIAQSGQRYYERQKDRWFLDAVNLYSDAVRRLDRDLSVATVRSRGFIDFRDYVARYVSSEAFVSIVRQTERLSSLLAAIRYKLAIQGLRVTVRSDNRESDYSAEIASTFSRFDQGAEHIYSFKFNDYLEMNHVEAQILDGVAFLHQETFSSLRQFRAANIGFQDPTIVTFDREVQFYVAYADHIARLTSVGLDFCYPVVDTTSKDIWATRTFDLALAGKLAQSNSVPVINDFFLHGPERIIVVSGPNQGGKTTFARTVGQLHYLACLGCPVPGTQSRLYLPDRIFTHFEREEHMAALRGKLEDDVVRIHAILEAATPQSLIIINEIFASTALRDAIFLSKRIADRILALDSLCVWVTFIEELASLCEKTVSMVSTVVPEDPAQRTFKIVRRPADGLAYAMSIAEKYRLTHDMIVKRIVR